MSCVRHRVEASCARRRCVGSAPVPPDVLDLFTELAAVPSPPGEERAVADLVTRYLRDCGLAVEEDGAGPGIGSPKGNPYARHRPTAGGQPPFLRAPLDTVPPPAAARP